MNGYGIEGSILKRNIAVAGLPLVIGVQVAIGATEHDALEWLREERS